MTTTRERVMGATETEDKAGKAVTELWAMLVEIGSLEERARMWALVTEIKEGLEFMPTYRMWAGAVQDLARGIVQLDLPQPTQHSFMAQGVPMHIKAVLDLQQRHQDDLAKLHSAAPLAAAAAAWVVEVERYPLLREAITEVIDEHAGLGAEVFGMWQDVRAQAASYKLRKAED